MLFTSVCSENLVLQNGHFLCRFLIVLSIHSLQNKWKHLVNMVSLLFVLHTLHLTIF